MVVDEGKPLELKCSISAKPLPSVAWYKNERTIRNFPPYKITFVGGVATLKVPKTEKDQAGSYKCVASNSNGIVTSKAEVVVKGKG